MLTKAQARKFIRRETYVRERYFDMLKEAANEAELAVVRGRLCFLGVEDPAVLDQIPGMDVACPDDPILEDPDAATPDFHDVGLDILTERHGDLVRGSGTLSVVQGQASVRINPDSLWAADDSDVGRELQIDGGDYEVIEVPDPTTLVLDRPVESADQSAIPFAAGSMRYGSPWQVRVPTDLMVLDRGALA